MKRAFRLCRHVFVRQLPALGAIAGMMAVLQSIFFFAALSKVEAYVPLRFEGLVDQSGLPAVFALALASLLVAAALFYVRGFMHTKNMYALLTLPAGRGVVYGAMSGAAFLGVLCLWSLQLLLVLVFHGAYAAKFIHDIPQSSLYISFLRSAFLRAVFPPHPLSALVSLVMLFALAAFAQSAAVHIKAGKPWPLAAFVLASAYPVSKVYPLLRHSPGIEGLKLFMAFCLLVAPVAAGMHLFRRGEVGK